MNDADPSRTPPLDGPVRTRTGLLDLARVFTWLGTVAVGGPAAHIAMMHEQLVVRRRWLSEARFLDLLGAAQLIPGPNSTELAIHIGLVRRGFPGLLVAGACFIVPAMLITGAFAYAYVEYQHRPALAWLFYGVKPVIVAVIAQAIHGLLRTAARTSRLRLLGVLALLSAALGVDELIVLFGIGAASAIVPAGDMRRSSAHAKGGLLFSLGALTASSLAQPISLPGLFGLFFKIGSVLFGSGYVLLSFLRAELVERLRWLSEPQLLDAIAVGQLTPGPVFTTATFIGYLLRGTGGALAATAGIFLPAFLFVAVSGPLIPRLRASARASRFLDGVNVASLALMIVVTVQLARGALVDAPTVLMLGASAYLLTVRKLDPTWLLLSGALLGVLVRGALR